MAKKAEETIVDVQEVYTKTELFLEKNRKTLTYIVGGVALAVLGYFAYSRLYQQPRELEASSSMWKAEEYFRIDSLDRAMAGDDVYPGFEQIAEDYAGTNTAKRAHYHIGAILRDRGQYEEAIPHFEEASGLGDEAIGPLATGNIGDMYVELGDYDQAVKYFEKAANRVDNGFITPYFLMKASIVYMENGDTDNAKRVLEIITEDWPDSNEAKPAIKYLASLGG